VLLKKAATLIETLIVILFVSILSGSLFVAGHGVYKIFVRMATNKYDPERSKTDPEGLQKRERDGIFYRKGWE